MVNHSKETSMTTTYQVADMMIGVRNMIEAADLRRGDQVLLLADTRSDKTTLEALTAGLRFFGAEPMTLVTEPIARYGAVPQAVLEAMHASDVVIWVWPVFITFTPAHRAMGRKREESGSQLHGAFVGAAMVNVLTLTLPWLVSETDKERFAVPRRTKYPTICWRA